MEVVCFDFSLQTLLIKEPSENKILQRKRKDAMEPKGAPAWRGGRGGVRVWLEPRLGRTVLGGAGGAHRQGPEQRKDGAEVHPRSLTEPVLRARAHCCIRKPRRPRSRQPPAHQVQLFSTPSGTISSWSKSGAFAPNGCRCL